MTKIKKNLFVILLAVTMIVVFMPVAGIQTVYADSSGSCGNNVTWTYSNGTLTISGSGAMTDYPNGESAPWLAEYRYDINSVVIKDGVTSIGDQAFNFCNRMTSISIPSSVTRIGKNAFYYCSSLSEIPLKNGLTSIGDTAFACCTGLNTISFPDSLTSIGNYVFNNCSALKKVTFPRNLTSIGRDLFQCCSNLETVVFSEGITKIGYDLCKGCPKLKNVSIPSTVKTIESNPFSYCPSLTNLSVDAGNQSFTVQDGVLFSKDKTKLVACPDTKSSYVIPSSVTSVGYGAFMGCSKLQNLTFADGITEIGGYAFRDCTSLLEVTLPSGVTELRDEAFYGCSALTGASLSENLISMGFSSFQGCSNLETITIPDSVTRIGAHSFNGCKKLSDISIPEGITNIEYYTFSDCESLQSITLPQSVQSISYYVFDGCSNLKRLKFLGNAPRIDGSAFRGITATAYYPIGDETWGGSVLLGYGGNITWEAYSYDLSSCAISNISDQDYTGNAIEPVVEVKIGNKVLVKDQDYTVSYADNLGIGTAKVKITGINNYSGIAETTFRIIPAKVTVPSPKKLTYNGKTQTGVSANEELYTISGNTGTKAGSYTAILTLKDNTNYTWSDGTTADKDVKWTISKAANPLKIGAKTAAIRYSKLRIRTQTLAVTKVIKFTKKLNDKKTYTLSSAKKGSKSFKKYFRISKTSGKVTVKKGLKKGTYKITVKVQAKGNSNYRASAVKTVTFKVIVK